MSRAWFVLQHVAWESAGLIAEVARERRVPLELRRMDQGAEVPSIDAVAGVVAMGGPMGVRDAPSLPFLAEEMLLLRAAVERQMPVLGVCLGAQLLAAALGARVERGDAPEVGIGEVVLTADGRSDPVLGRAGPTLPVVHWHEASGREAWRRRSRSRVRRAAAPTARAGTPRQARRRERW